MTAENTRLDDRDILEGARGVPTRPRRYAKRWLLLGPLVVVLVLVGGYIGVRWWQYAMTHVSTDDARVKGTLITVSSKVPGRLLSVVVEEGQSVAQGVPIARIQQDDYQAQVALQEAALEAAQSQLASATIELDLARDLVAGQIERSDAVLSTSQSQLTEAERAAALEDQRAKADLREKEAAVEEAKARLLGAKVKQDAALAELNRAKQLFQDGIVATEQRDHTAAIYDQAVAEYQSAQEARNKSQALLDRAIAEGRRVQLLLDNVRTQQRKVRESVALKSLAVAEQQRIRMKEEVVKTLQAKIKEATAQLELARLRLAETVITSPIAGVVSQTIADPGEHVQAGQPIAVVNDPQDVWVEANIEETYIRDVHIGQPVDLEVDAYPQQQFQGQVVQIGAATRSEFAIIPAGSASAHFIKVTQRLPVKIAVDNREGLLKPGMMVEVGIRVK
jgi:membrane fusion protein (multidrug efflux system)